MELIINQQKQTFIPLTHFRQTWQLPPEFELALFEPKGWAAPGSVEGTGRALAEIKRTTLQAIPAKITLQTLMPQTDHLATTFQHQLETVNTEVGLRPVEVKFAVSGFQDVLQAIVYNLIQLYHTHRQKPDQIMAHFDIKTIYQSWLNNSVRVATTPKHYQHNNLTFEIYIVYNAYGRIGLEVHHQDGVTYVLDPTLACPAMNYMQGLCEETGQRLAEAFGGGVDKNSSNYT